MKKPEISICVFLLVFFSVFNSSILLNDVLVSPVIDHIDKNLVTGNNNDNLIPYMLSTDYIEHEPFNIDGNDDFKTRAESEKWPGDGSELNPYIINGLSITGILGQPLLVSIYNTDVYFRISNCIIRSGEGLLLNYVSNSLITNNTLYECFNGINLESSQNNTITSNRIHNSEEEGIRIVSSYYNTVLMNTVNNNGARGIFLFESSENTISGNTIFNNGIEGIALVSNSKENFIQNNTLYNNYHGIWLSALSSYNTISSNFIYQNDYQGIYLAQSANGNTILANTFSNNNQKGIYIAQNSNNNVVKWNNFIGNGGILAQASDIGSWNVFTSNYWDDFIGTDADADGFFDDPYDIDGSSNNQDVHPLSSVHSLRPIAFTYPNGEEILEGTVTIQWTSTTDSYNHTMTYSVYYSADEGMSWILITSGLTTTSHDWDTNTISVGSSSYLIKVVASCSEGLIVEDISDDSFAPHLVNPIVLFPNGGETLRGIITIQWFASTDSLGHNISYTVYYSSDSGETWLQLASDLTETNYQWDTTTEVDSSNYLVKVVSTCSDGLTTEYVSNVTFTIQNIIPSSDIFSWLIPITLILISFLFVLFILFLGPIRSKRATLSASEDGRRPYSRTAPSITKKIAILSETPVKEPRLSKDVVSREPVEPTFQADILDHRVPDTSQDVSMKNRLLCVYCGSKLLKKGDQFCVYCGKRQPGE
ncbi:MAG: right-handed parallel beta-helix repeat-containing protein [Candidatus Hodarchaeales archaeon]|jgi:parallel beta-helix repeat protein